MSHFESNLKDNAADIERALETLLAAGPLSGPDAPPERLVAAMRHGTLNGGKRLRPFLLRETAAMLAGDALLTLSFAHLAEHGSTDAAVRARLVVELAAGAGAGGMVGGQMRD